MKKKQFWQYIAIVLIVSLFLGILIYFSSILDLLGVEFSGARGRPGENSIVNIIAEVFIRTMVAFGTFILNYFILRPLNSSIKLDIKRIAIAILLTLVSVTILSDSFFAIKRFLSESTAHKSFNLLYTSRDIFTGIIVLAGILFIKTFYDKQAIRIENEKLKGENLLAQYNHLKTR